MGIPYLYYDLFITVTLFMKLEQFSIDHGLELMNSNNQRQLNNSLYG